MAIPSKQKISGTHQTNNTKLCTCSIAFMTHDTIQTYMYIHWSLHIALIGANLYVCVYWYVADTCREWRTVFVSFVRTSIWCNTFSDFKSTEFGKSQQKMTIKFWPRWAQVHKKTQIQSMSDRAKNGFHTAMLCTSHVLHESFTYTVPHYVHVCACQMQEPRNYRHSTGPS